MAATIDLHWAATPYTRQRSGLYHSIISGTGQVQRMHAYTVDLPARSPARPAAAASCLVKMRTNLVGPLTNGVIHDRCAGAHRECA